MNWQGKVNTEKKSNNDHFPNAILLHYDYNEMDRWCDSYIDSKIIRSFKYEFFMLLYLVAICILL